MAEATNSVTSPALNGWAAHYSHSVPKPEPANGVRCTRLFSKARHFTLQRGHVGAPHRLHHGCHRRD